MSQSARAARTALLTLPLLALALVLPPADAAAPRTRPAPRAATAPAKPALAKPAPTSPTAAPAAKPAPGPWLYRGSDVPQDKEWVFGELPNGLRYAVRSNGVPPGQVSIRVRVDVGSLFEREHERGYAHFLEHLVFRQSQYLGEGEAIHAWQRLGASFGSDTNAETTPTGTTFSIDLPDATPAGLDESMKYLSGMVIAPTLSDKNIQTDLPIVLAEKRERGGAAARVQDALREVLYAGQPLATRSPIGTEATLTAANQTTVRAFHARWYRPENTVVVLAGDRPTAELEALVQKWFAGWSPPGPHTPAPSFGDPVAPPGAVKAPGGGSVIGQTRVLVEPDLPRNITWATLRPWRPVNDTVAYNQGLMIDQIAQAVINRRLEARARGGGSFLVAQVNQQDVSRSTDATFVSVTPLGEDWRAAVKDVRAVIADAMASPPTAEEIAREVAELDVAFASAQEQQALQPGSRLADDIVQAVDIRETVANPDAVLRIFRESVPLITPQAVLQHTRQLFAGTVTRGVLVTPRAADGTAALLRQALAAPVVADGKARLANKPISFDQLPPIGTPGRVAAAVPTGIGQIEQIELANGVKALIWPSNDEPGRVTVKVRFGAGYRAFGPDDAPYIQLGQMALVGSGEATLGQEELDRISTGRKMGFDFKIDDADFTFSADTRQADLADQLYLFAAKLAMPRWDEAPVLRARAASRLQYDGLAASPQGVLQRDLKWLQHNRDPRYRTPTPGEIEAASPAGFRKVWEPVLASGPIEVQVFGDINRDSTVEALTRTFGALAPRAPAAEAMASTAAQVPPGGGAPAVLTHHGDANQAAALVAWPTGGGMAGVRVSRQLEILTNLFTNRLLDRMREKLGASYAPQVFSSWPLDLDSGGAITAIAQLQPRDVPVFFQTADEIAADLVANPPTADELARVIEPLKQQITRAATSSAFFMYQLEGATTDPSRFAAIRTIMPDYTVTTPAIMQGLAKQFLSRERSWRAQIVPAARPAAAAGR
ncbi:M16 family metallopeptidase [Novosphingobium piscinae]|uniref:Insulinase family protein n=1 Tax=Novosphingobium piscinae TaxID=1507448 RepID=A0A7X1FXM9_9SPHN|nr:M16 family metallopeptidase [Novosphingobium piscinae]MBC2668242.1 insulinase family protein [Novosphingobium piscinae]